MPLHLHILKTNKKINPLSVVFVSEENQALNESEAIQFKVTFHLGITKSC